MEAASAPAGVPQTPSTLNPSQNGAAGVQAPAKAPPPTTVVRPNPAPKPGERAKGPDGKFIAKTDSEKPPEPAKEPYRFKRKLKINGNEEDVDLSEDDLQREVQIARAARQQLAAIKKERQELDALREKLKTTPHEYLKEAGHDPDKWAAEHLAKKAQDGLMSEEERAFRAQQTELEQLRAEKQERVKQDEDRELRAHEDKLWAQEEPRYLKAMEAANLPKGSHVMSVLADVGTEFLDAKIALDPEQIVAEVSSRLDASASRYVLGLPTEQLVTKLGPEKVRAIVQHHLEAFKARQAAFNDAPTQSVRTHQQPEPTEKRQFLTAREVEERARAFRAKL